MCIRDSLSVEEAIAQLGVLKQKFTKLWDEQSASYRDFKELQRKAPSQYLALQQLIYRSDNHRPIMAAVAAPAGYGKSQIIVAWLTHLQTVTPVQKWVVLAVTGVAASSAGGTTLRVLSYAQKCSERYLRRSRCTRRTTTCKWIDN